uniref:Ribonuclease H protein At1g65750 family n=1 Tax=Cajanus cajan TaxID=3821 RepID=A0A151R1U6_CAJCA|nr:Putative ribonuclease H protein At1g65750 family [Cajanus cajan]
MGGKVKWRVIRKLIVEEDAQIVCIQETKKEDIDERLCKLLWGDGNCEWRAVPAINTAGGLLCLWNGDKFQVSQHFEGVSYLGLEGVWKDNGLRLNIVNVYAPCQRVPRMRVWEEIKDKRRLSSVNLWCVVGDFNSIRCETERVSMGRMNCSQSDMRAFNDFIEKMEVEDLPIVGRRFSWYKTNGTVRSRLDRILVSREWFLAWPGSIQMIMDRCISDHCPIKLQVSNSDWGPKPFRSLDHWFQDPSFKKFVVDTWKELCVHGWGAYVLKEKLKLLKQKLREWNSVKFEDPVSSQKRIVNILSKLQNKFWEVAIRNESILAQKSRVSWLKEGDMNTKFFHLMINWRRRKNELKGLFINGVWSDETMVVKDHVRQFFKQRFQEQYQHRPVLDGVRFKVISSEQNNLLIAPFTEVEIKSAVWECCMYKILSKVLANRLKCVLPSVIDERQSAFIGEEFGVKKGLKQGDPLSPFLFTIVAEGLTGMMREAVSQKRFCDVKVGSQQVPISIIQYADDTMFIGEAKLENVMAIKSMMRCFEMVSGLKVNFCKSKFGAMGIDSTMEEGFAQLLNCSLLSFPFTYLGIPIGANPRKFETWRPIVIKIQKKLSSWKCKVLSMAGRLCLINSVLTSLPLLFLSFFRMPVKVSKQIVRLQRNFLWGCKEDQRKICWISWDRITLPKKMGGLGVKNITRFNMALLAKWRWSIFHQRHSLWARVLYSRYGGGTNLCAQSSSRSDSIWWRDLLLVCGGIEQDNWFERQLKWKIGSGSRVRFWLDSWMGTVCLAKVFPRLFNISEKQNSLVQDMEYSLRPEQDDSWGWQSEPSGSYTVRYAYHAITSETIAGSYNDVPNCIWSIPAPPKAKIFVWRMMSRGLPTVDNLARRRIVLSDNDALCVFCKKDIESDYHLFCTCPVVDKVWKVCLNWISCPAPLPSNILDHFNFIPGPIQHYEQVVYWRSIWLATTWTVWRTRNRYRFNDNSFSFERLVNEIQVYSWRWLSSFTKTFRYTFSQWCYNPGLCMSRYTLK